MQIEVKIDTEYIKLDQCLKFANVVASGGEAKYFIFQEMVRVNGKIESKRGRKLFKNDKVTLEDVCIVIV